MKELGGRFFGAFVLAGEKNGRVEGAKRRRSTSLTDIRKRRGWVRDDKDAGHGANGRKGNSKTPPFEGREGWGTFKTISCSAAVRPVQQGGTPPSSYQPDWWPLFCSSSQVLRGAK